MNIRVKSGMKAGDLCLLVHGQERDDVKNLGGFTCQALSSNVDYCRGPESKKADLDNMGLNFRYKTC
jgi:hypothetical protein